MRNTINPEMLLLARESRGLSQSDLSSLLNISQAKLSKAEKGEQTLNDDLIPSLVRALGYPESFFYQAAPTSPVSHYYFRRKLSIPQKNVAQIESNVKILRQSIDYLIDSVELPEAILPSFNIKKEEPEEIARKARYLLKIPNGPIGNLVNVLERLGIIVFKTDFLFTEKVDGLSTISEKGVKIIFLNKTMSNDRQRFSLAHEFGHMLMHFENFHDPDTVEDEANRFAAEFLMPEAEIKNNLRSLTIAKLGDLKRHWKVSMKALLYRAKTLKTITPDQYRNFQIQFSKMGIAKVEPIQLPEESSFLLNEIVKLHMDELGYTLEELSRITRLEAEEFVIKFTHIPPPKLRIVRFQ